MTIDAFRTILCPVDLSPASGAALRTARVMAGRLGAELCIIFVEDPLLSRAAQLFDEKTLAERTRSELTRFVEQAIGDQECQYVIVSGGAADEILKAADRLGAHMIVMGTQGASGPQRLFFGSTTQAVLRQTTVPVLAVPPDSR